MRRRRATLILLAASALLVNACSGAETDTPDAPAEVEVLRIAVPRDTGPLNIFAGSPEPIAELVYDKLVAPSPYVDEPQPWLATAVREVDSSTWEVDLRQGVSWHDGQPFTVDDVVFTFEYMKVAPTGRWTHHVTHIPTISEITAVDTDTVRFSCGFPCPELGEVTLADLPIIPKHVWSAVPPDTAKAVKTLPVGTGPYRLVDHNPTSGYRFEANPTYFAGTPRVRELVMPVIEDPSATFTALRSGEIDAAARPLSPELIDQFSNSSQVDVVKTAPLQFPELRMNFEHVPFEQAEFRRAISRAVDRDQLLETVFLGQGRPADKGYPHPDAPFANPSLSTPYAPDEARQLLDQAGFVDRDGDGVREGPDGPLRYQLFVTASLPIDVRAAELVAEDLREVGIEAQVTGTDAATVANLFTTRDFDLAISTITAHGVADPDQFIMSHLSGYLWRAPKIPYPEFDALYDQWEAASTNADRNAVLQDMQALFNRQPTSIPLYYPDEYWAFRAGSYGGWVESPGFGIVHKWSLLPPDVARTANAVVAQR
ncbi:MAG: ABC transporter substrate-binding protein [Pseudonocardiaceae bacterium]